MPLKRRDTLKQASVPELGKPETSYPSPNIADQLVIERVPITPKKYRPLPYHSPHPDYDNNGLILVWQGKVRAENNQIAIVRVYSNNLGNDDWYNYAIKYSGDVNATPIFVRSYIDLRKDYVALPKGAPLQTMMRLRVTAQGAGYTYGTAPTVTLTGGGASTQATVRAIMNPDGKKVIGLELLTAGVGYTGLTPIVVGFSGGSGAGVVATAEIQPANAYLVHEETSKLDNEDSKLASLFWKVNRVYETLPGPWIPFQRWDDDLGAIFGQRRAILTAAPPDPAESSATTKTEYVSREGSAIVSIETFESWGDVPYAHEFAKEIPDRIPVRFRDLLPTRTTGQTEVGEAAEPVLGPGEIARTSKEVNKFWRHETVTDRDLTLLPVTRRDYELDGIPAGGAEHGGIFETSATLSDQPQNVEEGFLITESSKIDLGGGLSVRETKRLTGALPARLLLTFPGSGFSAPPIVVFSAVAGGSGIGADGTAVLSAAPVIPPSGEPGGVFNLVPTDFGDDDGVFFFLGARYNGGVWRNPTTNAVIEITAASHPAYPLSQAQLAKLVDRSAADQVTVITQPGGGHYIVFDLQVGRTLKPTRIMIRQANPVSNGVHMQNLRVEGFNDFVNPPVTVGSDVPIPQTAGEWSDGALNNAVGYRYFRVYGTDDSIPGTEPALFPSLALGEIELYGELTIVPGIQLTHSFNGDTHGVFHHLGALANGGVWQNPHSNPGGITLAADALTFGTLDALVDRQASDTHQDGTAGRAYYIDLLAGRSLVCNKVSYRNRTGANSLARTVQFQGTNVIGVTVDGDWTTLVSFDTPFNADAWLTTDVPGATGYRRFRLKAAASAADFAIGEIELYGALTFPQVAPPIGYSVERVNMIDAGENYADPPDVVFSGGGGTGASGDAILDGNGGVESVLMTNHGSGYTAIPDVDFIAPDFGGIGAAATAIIDGSVIMVNMVDGGFGYEVPPTVVFGTGPFGSGHDAAGTAVIAFALDSIDVTDPGNGDYATAPTVDIDPPDSATATAFLSYALDSIDLIDGGSGYGSAPSVGIDPPTGVGGIQATAHAEMGTGPDVATLTYSSPGDNGGVFHFIGRNYNSEAWVNPAPVGRVTFIKSSTLAGDDPPVSGINDFTDRDLNYNTTDNNSDGVDFIGVDFGAGKTMDVVEYSIQNGANGDFTHGPRNWVLEGSNDVDPPYLVSDYNAATWDLLDTRTNNTDIASTEGAWGQFTATSATGYRFLRVRTTGDDQSVDGTNFLQISELEFYGDFAYPGVPTDEVASVVIDDPGYGYLVQPAVTFTGSNTTPADADAVLEATGYVDHINIITNGLFEAPGPDITLISGTGTGATADAILEVGGEVIGVIIDDMGSDYQGAPDVTFVPVGADPGQDADATAEIVGPVVDFVIDAGGTGYDTPPDVLIGAPDVGDTATGTATVGGGAVTDVVLVDGGTGYDERPPVVFTPTGGPQGVATIAFGVDHITLTGNQATGTLTRTANVIDGNTVTIDVKVYTFKTALTPTEGQVLIGASADASLLNLIRAINHSGTPDVDYKCALAHPTVTAATSVTAGAFMVTAILAGTGGNSIATTEVSAFLSWGSATLTGGTTTGGGSGYASAPPVQIDGDGQGATAYSLLGRGILRVEVIAQGANYNSSVIGHVSSPLGFPGGDGGATLTVQRKFGIESATVTAPGSGYTSDPVVTAPSPEGTDAIFRAIRGLPLDSVLITNGGQDYTSAPTATFASPFGGGTLATGDAVLGFGVDDVDMTAMGTGYTSAPNVELRAQASGGSGATAAAELLGRSIATIVVDNGGTGYTSPPTVIIGDGNNATGTAVLTGTVVTSITIVDAGTGYVTAPTIFIGADGGGTGAHAFATLTANQDMRIIVTNPGSGYEDPPDVIITQGGGTGATADANLLTAGSVKRVDITNPGTNYIQDAIIAFSGGAGADAAGTGLRDLDASGTVALITVEQAGDGYVATTVNCVITGGGGSGATAVAVKKTLGSIKSVTVTAPGAGFVDPPVIYLTETAGVGFGAVLRAVLTATGNVVGVVMTSAGEGYTVAPDVTFPASDGTGAAATAFLMATGSIDTLTLTVAGGPFTIAPLVSFVPPGNVPLATALYLLPQAWPTLIDLITDPTDKLIVQVVKDIVPYSNSPVLPPGYSELQALNKYRTIQIVSSIIGLPAVERFKTTQHVALPHLLFGVIPVWSTRTAFDTAMNAASNFGAGLGSAGATAEISGSIVILKIGGFRGAAISLVERTHFRGIPPDSSIPLPTIIRPSTGTAYIKGGAHSVGRKGALTPFILGTSGGIDPNYNVTVGSDSSISSNVQIVDISDVLTAGLNIFTINGVTQASGAGTAHTLDVLASVQGTFSVNIPASCPAVLTPGSTILQEVGVEKRRFNLWVRTIIYVIVPGGCGPVGSACFPGET